MAALLGAGYYVYTLLNKVPDVLASTGSAIGTGFADFQDAIYRYFGGKPVGETLFYTVHFSNGAHAIPASTVDSSGHFTYRGAKFVMRFKPIPTKTAPDAGEWWAFAP